MQAIEYSTAAEMRSAAHALRQRLMKPWNAVKVIVALPAPKQEIEAPEHPLWQRHHIQFDEHVKTWTLSRLRAEKHRFKDYIRDRARELGIPFDMLLSDTRDRAVCWARQDIIYELRTKFTPPPTYPELARIFRKDSSTLVHAVEAASKRANQPKLKALSHLSILRTDLALARRVMLDFYNGHPFAVIGERYKLSRESIAKIAKENGWKREKTQARVVLKEWMPYEKALEIKAAYYSGLPREVICTQFGISTRALATLRHRYCWPARPRPVRK